MMRSIVFALLFSCVLLSHTILAKKKAYMKKCMRKTGVTVTAEMIDDLQQAHKEGNFDKDTIPDDILCIPKCFLEERQIIDGSGKISIERLSKDLIMKTVPKKDVFLNCVKNIDEIANCPDMKKLVQCRLEAD